MLTGMLLCLYEVERIESDSSRTSYLITMVFSFITAAVIAEVCSASPSAGSIYLWAAEAGGAKYGRLLGFVVAWWSTTAWMTFCASNISRSLNSSWKLSTNLLQVIRRAL